MTVSQQPPTSSRSGRFATLPKRIAVAVVAIPAILWLSIQGGYLFFGLIVLLSSLALYEFYKLAEKKGAFPLKIVGLLAGLLVNSACIYERLQIDVFEFFADRGIHLSMFSQHQFLSVILIVFVLLVALLELFRTQGSPLLNLGSTVAGVLCISLCFGTLVMMRELFPYGFPMHRFFSVSFADDNQIAQVNRWGGMTVIALFATIWACDTAAYFGGLLLGRHKLFERVSPGKTWEGAVFGCIFAVATMVLAQNLVLPYLRLSQAIVIGSFVGVFGQIGDLIESRFKRDAGVKDSSAIIPGHGGVYDRFDSLVFVAPIVYLYMDFVVLS
ncbi:MAG: phosphatidate cytidylyltransferase [Bacteroidota bacterium]